MKASKKNLLATSLLALPALASALGLGGIDVKSGLNQPLEAEIPITVASNAERESLQVGLARAEDWSRVGIDPSRIAVPLDFVVAKNSRGESIIRVTSKEIVRDPFLQLLIEVNWNKGRLLREYSLLLDPPTMAPALQGSSSVASGVKEPVPAARTQPLVSTQVPATTPPASTPRPTTQTATPPPPPAAPANAGGSYGPIKAGDTLWVIANGNRPSPSANLDQVMVSILRMNPQAFYQANINALKKGAILRLPSADEANQVSVAEASKAIQSQNALWRSYQTRSAQEATLVSDPGSSPAVREPTDSSVSAEARLALVPPKSGNDTGINNGASAKALNEAKAEIARLKEEAASQGRESSEATARIAELERIRADQERMLALKSDELAEKGEELAERERMITLKSNELAALQKQLEEAREVAARTPEPVTPTPVETTPVETVPVATTPDPVATTTPDPVATTPDPVATTTPDPAVTEPTTGSTSNVTDIWGDDAASTSTESSASEPVTPDSASIPSEFSENADPMTPDPAATPGDGTTVTPIEEAPVVTTEPVAEPDVTAASETSSEPASEPTPVSQPWYMNPITWAAAGGVGLLALLGLAFGRRKKPAVALPAPVSTGDMDFGIPSMGPAVEPAVFAPSDDTLDDDESRIHAAIASNPQDLWAHLDLLRLYYGRHDAQAFEQTASIMYGHVTDPESPQWQEARTMGEQIVPHSSLFAPTPDFGTLEMPRSQASNAPAFVDESLGTLDLGSFDEPVRAAPMPTASTPTAVMTPLASPPLSDFSFDLDLDQPTRKLEPVAFSEPLPPTPMPTATPTPVAAKADEFNFDFNFDAPSVPVEIKPPVIERPELSFDAPMDFPKFDKFDKFDKLDVAPALPPAYGVGEIAFGDVVPVPPMDTVSDLNTDDLMFGDDAVSTKLDLARAYLDMGDPDGARSMLEEVISEGSDMQRSEAKELLGRIA